MIVQRVVCCVVGVVCARAEVNFRLWGRNESQYQFEYGRGEGGQLRPIGKNAQKQK